MGKLQIEIQGAVERLNDSLNPAGYEIKIGHRNNYTAIDLYKHPEGGMLNYLDAGLTDRQALNIIYAMAKACELLRNPRVKDDSEFWVKTFAPRSDKWKRDTLKRLRSDAHTFGTLEETADKIKALKYLLNI